jgi:two-component system, chemotaxis family, chemotaxis protein CheY
MKVLVVDDSRSIRTIEKKILQGFGFEVFEACEGADALTQLNNIPGIGLVMVDRNMPVMDGLEFIKSVRANTENSGIRLVMVTSETETSSITEVLSAGADEYIMKPFNQEVLRDKLMMLGVLS